MNRRLAALRPNKADKALAMTRATVYVVFMAAALAAAVSDATQSTAQGIGSGATGMQGPGSTMQFPGIGAQQQDSIASQMLVPSGEWLEFGGGVISGLFNQPGPALSRRRRSRHDNR